MTVTPVAAAAAAARKVGTSQATPGFDGFWLGHDSVETTQIYLDAHLALKEAALAKTTPLNGKVGRYRAGDQLLQFLSTL